MYLELLCLRCQLIRKSNRIKRRSTHNISTVPRNSATKQKTTLNTTKSYII